MTVCAFSARVLGPSFFRRSCDFKGSVISFHSLLGCLRVKGRDVLGVLTCCCKHLQVARSQSERAAAARLANSSARRLGSAAGEADRSSVCSLTLALWRRGCASTKTPFTRGAMRPNCRHGAQSPFDPGFERATPLLCGPQ